MCVRKELCLGNYVFFTVKDNCRRGQVAQPSVSYHVSPLDKCKEKELCVWLSVWVFCTGFRKYRQHFYGSQTVRNVSLLFRLILNFLCEKMGPVGLSYGHLLRGSTHQFRVGRVYTQRSGPEEGHRVWGLGWTGSVLTDRLFVESSTCPGLVLEGRRDRFRRGEEGNTKKTVFSCGDKRGCRVGSVKTAKVEVLDGIQVG